MNPGSVLVFLILAFVVVLILRSLYRSRQAGNACSCGLPEGTCGMCAKKQQR